jgi:hypothetical protein
MTDLMPRDLSTHTEINSDEFIRTDGGRSIYVQRVEFICEAEFSTYENALTFAAMLTACATCTEFGPGVDEIIAAARRIAEGMKHD